MLIFGEQKNLLREAACSVKLLLKHGLSEQDSVPESVCRSINTMQGNLIQIKECACFAKILFWRIDTVKLFIVAMFVPQSTGASSEDS